METKSNPRFRHMKAHIKIKAIKHIPQDIVEEILLRLPVKNLSRFKCVSKPWCSVISSKSFIKAHLERSRKSPSLEHHWIIMDYCSHLQKQCSLPSFLQHPPTKFADVKDPPYSTGDVVGVVGSCNGLVCLLTKSAEFILWNPTTRKCMELDSIFNGTRGTYDRIVAYGFGFDESNDEYKIFGVVYRHDDGKYQQKIYGSKMNSWRKIADDANSTMIFGSGKLVSGKLHWAPITYPSMSSDIVTLDLEKEVFGAAEWPRCDKYEHGYSSASVQVIDECLSCLVSYASQSRIDVWILKKKDSWCLLATGTSNPPGKGGWTLAPDRPNLLQPISAGAKYKGGEEKLTRMYSCLYVHHRDDVCFSKPCLVSAHACLKVIKYVESLEMI